MRWSLLTSWAVAAFVGWALMLLSLVAAEPSPGEADYAEDLPRIPPVAASDALGTMEVADGFTLALVAAEPMLASPVAIDWDEDGRLFVCEMRGYSENEADRLGRIRLLLDDDRDGRPDRAEVFAEGFAWPTAICCWGGGVFVGDAPDIFFLRDTDGDGRADEKRRVFTGFGTGNVQGLFNSFRVGIDNRIHGSASSSGGEVRRVEDGEPVGEADSLRGRDFSFDPRSGDLRPETGGCQHGMSFDDCGNRYVCSNSDHAIRCMLDDRSLGRNPDYPAPPGRESIAVEGPQAEVFRVSPVEPWRVLRTRLRASGIVPGIVEGGGRPAGYFTSATGITVVRGDAVGDLRGMLVMGDVGSNLVHRKRLRPHGSGVRAERVDVGHELIASRDIWFRPVQFANGPDGALWIVDMQREVIEHPKSLPPGIKEHLDLTSGREAGRLWRLTAGDAAARPLPPPLRDATTEQLVQLLAHPNAWQRETAQRLLVGRSDAAAADPLRRMLADEAAAPLGRLHALWALEGLGVLTPSDLQLALQAPIACVRAAGVRLAGGCVEPPQAGAAIDETLLRIAREEPEIDVRLQLACTAGGVASDTQRRALLSLLLQRDGADHWCRIAACSAMHRGDAAAIATEWIESQGMLASPQAQAVMPELFAQIGRGGRPHELTAAVAAIAEMAAAAVSDEATLRAAGLLETLTLAVGGTLESTGDTGRLTQRLSRQLAADCLRIATDASRPAAQRAEATRGLALAGLDSATAAAAAKLLRDENAAVAVATIEAVGRLRTPSADALVVDAISKVADAVRPRALAAATATAVRAQLLLAAIADGRLAVGSAGQSTLERLWRFPDAAVREEAIAVLGPPPPEDRQTMVNAYSASLPDEPGDAAAGRAVFRQHCVSCHKVEGAGHELGPSLAAMQARGPEAMLLGILDPNREVLPAFTARTAVGVDGRVVTGVLKAEGDTSVTLVAAEGVEHLLARDEIDELIDTRRSLMPEGFERSIDPRAMNDLLAYLMSAR